MYDSADGCYRGESGRFNAADVSEEDRPGSGGDGESVYHHDCGCDFAADLFPGSGIGVGDIDERGVV